jgi:autotransporter-associated beta strand protein
MTTVINDGTIQASAQGRAIDFFLSGTGTSNSPAGVLTIFNRGLIEGQIFQAITFSGNIPSNISGYISPLNIENHGIIRANAYSLNVFSDKTQNNIGSDFTIRNFGFINGNVDLGDSPDMVVNVGTIQGDIDFGQSDARQGSLVLRTGSVFTGRAVTRPGTNRPDRVTATLSLSGTGADSFDVSQIGTVAAPGTGRRYQGFAHFFKEGPSTWTLTGTVDPAYRAPVPGQFVSGTPVVPPPVIPTWWISGGRLIGSTDSIGAWGIRFGGRREADGVAEPGDPDHKPVAGANAVFEFRQATDAVHASVISQCNFTGDLSNTCGVAVVGRVVKSGAGILRLTGANTYSGGTTILEGVLEISADTALGVASGGVTLDGGTLRVLAPISTARPVSLGAGGGTLDTQGNLTLTTAVTGAGTLTKTGNATLILSAANSYQGATVVRAGELRAAVAGALPATTSLQIDAAATVTLQAAQQITGLFGTGLLDLGAHRLTIGGGNFAGTINGAEEIRVTGGGTLTLSGTNTSTGGTSVRAGSTLEISRDAQLGAAASGLVLGSGGALRITDNLTSTRPLLVEAGGGVIDTNFRQLNWAGTLSGTDSLTIIGGGALILPSDNPGYGGTLRVSNATLTVQGALPGAGVQVMAGGLLNGNGRIGTLEVATGGTVSPGNSIGLIPVLRDYVQTGVYAAQFRPPPLGRSRGRNVADGSAATLAEQDADLILVSGTARLTGGTLVPVALGTAAQFAAARAASPTGELRYLVLRAQGGLGGTRYASLSNIATVRTEYPANGTDVELVVSGTPGGLDDDGDDRPTILLTTAPPAALTARDATLRQWGLSQNGMLFDLAADCDRPIGLSAATRDETWCSFGQGRLLTASGEGGDGMSAYGSAWAQSGLGQSRLRVADAATGVMRRTGEETWLGFAIGYGLGWFDFGGAGGEAYKTSFNALQLAALGRWAYGPLELRGLLGYGWSEVESRRPSGLRGGDARLVADYDLRQATAAGEARWWFGTRGDRALAPTLRLTGARQWRGGYSEEGTSADRFTAQQATWDSLRMALGVTGEIGTSLYGTPLVVEPRLGWVRELGDRAVTVTGSYAGAPGVTMSGRGGPAPRDSAVVGLAAIAQLTNSTRLRLGYDGAWSEGGNSDSVSMRMSYAW